MKLRKKNKKTKGSCKRKKTGRSKKEKRKRSRRRRTRRGCCESTLQERVYTALLNGTSHSSEDLLGMENMQQRSQPWFDLRKMSFGASIIGGLLDQSDWISAGDALDNFLYGFRAEPWVQSALQHGCRREDQATKLFLEEYQRMYCGDGEHFQMQVSGMMKAEGYEMLHCSLDGLVEHHKVNGEVIYYIREGKCPYTKRNFDIAANVAVDEFLLPKLMPTRGGVHSKHDERMPPCATGPKARERTRLRIHRGHYAQVQLSAFLWQRATGKKLEGILYDVCLCPDDEDKPPQTHILRIEVDAVYGKWLAEEGKKLWNEHKAEILDVRRLPFFHRAQPRRGGAKKKSRSTARVAQRSRRQPHYETTALTALEKESCVSISCRPCYSSNSALC